MGKFCFICGKKTDKLIEGMCEDCYINRIVLAEIPKKIDIVKCPVCGRIKVGSRWIAENDDVLRKIIEKNIKLKEKVDEIEIFREDDTFEVVLRKKIIKKTKVERHKVKIHYDKRICETCIKKKSGYYRSKLQLRGEVTDRVIKHVERELNNMDGVFYTIKKVRGGYDFLVNSKSAVKKIEKSLRRKYSVEVNRGYKLVTRKLGKNVYRDVVSVRIKDIYR